MPAPPSGAAASAPVGRDRFDGWRPRSLRARQLLAASLALLAFLALAGYALDRAFVDTAEDNLRQRLKSYALYYTDKVEFGRNGTLIPPYNTPDPRFDMPDSGMYAQVVLQGVPPWGSNSTLGPELPVPRMLGALEESFEGPLPIRRADGSESEEGEQRQAGGEQLAGTQRTRPPPVEPVTADGGGWRGAGGWRRHQVQAMPARDISLRRCAGWRIGRRGRARSRSASVRRPGPASCAGGR